MPNSIALARSVEYFRIPRNVVTTTVGKSTCARCGIVTSVTPFEPEWEGYVTLEISNTRPLPARICASEGIAQLLFFRGSEPPLDSCRDRKGRYQGQMGVNQPRLWPAGGRDRGGARDGTIPRRGHQRNSVTFLLRNAWWLHTLWRVPTTSACDLRNPYRDGTLPRGSVPGCFDPSVRAGMVPHDDDPDPCWRYT